MAVKRLPLPMRPPAPRPRLRATARRLSDKVRAGFHTACDDGAVEIAKLLLDQLETLIHRPPILPTGIDRRRPEPLTSLRERLANLLLWRIGIDGDGQGIVGQ